VEINLKGMYRNGNEYVKFVNDLPAGQSPHPDMPYEFTYFSDIDKMIDELRKMVNHNRKSTLVASFSEAKGDLNNPDSMDNLRAGYPLSSGFDLYKVEALCGVAISGYWETTVRIFRSRNHSTVAKMETETLIIL
jgi:hypothetical protein